VCRGGDLLHVVDPLDLAPESRCRSAWNDRAAVVRCSGGEGLTDAQPCEREFYGGHRGAESLGSGAFLLRDGLLGLTLSATGGCLLAGVGGRGGCCCHVWLFSRGKLILEPRKDCFSRGAFGANKPAIAEALTHPPHRGYAPARTAPLPLGSLLQAPTTVATSNRTPTAI
jgi:hypothetical protein